MSDSSELRKARILMLMEGLEAAGITPIQSAQLHAIAYLANVLSPIWDMPPHKRAVVHKESGPYFPELQTDVDHLVGKGIVGVSNLKYRKESDGRWRVSGLFFLADFDASRSITKSIRRFTDEEKLHAFYRELAFAFAAIPKEVRGKAVAEDAVYDVDVGEDVIIDFAQWKQENFSENAARYFDHVMPDGRPATAAQKLHLYAWHLKRRLAADG